MTAAREEILRRIRGALRDVPVAEQPADLPVSRAYRRRGEMSRDEVLDRLEDRLRDYGASVQRVAPDGAAEAVDAVAGSLGLRRLAVPPQLPDAWRPRECETVVDAPPLSATQLDEVDGAVTGCAAAIAETGTLVLDGRGACGRRALTLVPDHHICLVTAAQVSELVPEGLARVAPADPEDRRPVTLISGPSASSDIELIRVEGVHGPRHLFVLLLG